MLNGFYNLVQLCGKLDAGLFDVQLIIEEKGVGRFVTLNRPRVLNCINLSMVFSFSLSKHL
jgi:hypothetical protein